MINGFSKESEEMDERGEGMDCLGCSNSVCLAQQPSDNKRDIAKRIVFDKDDLNICPVCRKHVNSDDKYCRECGQRIILR